MEPNNKKKGADYEKIHKMVRNAWMWLPDIVNLNWEEVSNDMIIINKGSDVISNDDSGFYNQTFAGWLSEGSNIEQIYTWGRGCVGWPWDRLGTQDILLVINKIKKYANLRKREEVFCEKIKNQ